jgi:hypothetical protein
MTHSNRDDEPVLFQNSNVTRVLRG